MNATVLSYIAVAQAREIYNVYADNLACKPRPGTTIQPTPVQLTCDHLHNKYSVSCEEQIGGCNETLMYAHREWGCPSPEDEKDSVFNGNSTDFQVVGSKSVSPAVVGPPLDQKGCDLAIAQTKPNSTAWQYEQAQNSESWERATSEWQGIIFDLNVCTDENGGMNETAISALALALARETFCIYADGTVCFVEAHIQFGPTPVQQTCDVLYSQYGGNCTTEIVCKINFQTLLYAHSVFGCLLPQKQKPFPSDTTSFESEPAGNISTGDVGLVPTVAEHAAAAVNNVAGLVDATAAVVNGPVKSPPVKLPPAKSFPVISAPINSDQQK